MEFSDRNGGCDSGRRAGRTGKAVRVAGRAAEIVSVRSTKPATIGSGCDWGGVRSRFACWHCLRMWIEMEVRLCWRMGF